jgi:RNA polymerase sigma factor (sigma-70 family)
MVSDGELLRRYMAAGDEEAFREIVERYINLVFAAARRQVQDAHLAEDVTQLVFVRLARNARRLRPDSVLAGWLHADTRLTALQVLRQERRRRAREGEMIKQPSDEQLWKSVSPLIDEALDRLAAEERDAVLLRVMQQRSFEEVGEILGTTPDAARMRVNRALEKVRVWLEGHGVKSTSAALGIVLGAFAAESAPGSLAATVASAAAATTVTTSAILGGMIMTKAKILVGAAVVLGLGTPLLLEHVKNRALRARTTALEQQIVEIQSDRENEGSKLRSLTNAAAVVPSLRAEIARLRGENDRLKSAATQPSQRVAEKETRKAAETKPATQITEADVSEFLGRSAGEQGSILGALRAAMTTGNVQNREEYERNVQLAQRVRPQLEELERRPQDYAAFQTEFIKAVAGLKDDGKVAQIQELLQNTYQQAVGAGLDAPSKPAQNVEEWKLKRDALDRPATRALEAILSDDERGKFGRAFLGVMGIDLGTGDGGWHRFKNEGGGFYFPSEQK